MKITLSVTLPDDLAQEFLQAIREFDTKYDPNHENKIVVQMLAESKQTAEQMEAVFGALRPRMEHMHAFKLDS